SAWPGSLTTTGSPNSKRRSNSSAVMSSSMVAIIPLSLGSDNYRGDQAELTRTDIDRPQYDSDEPAILGTSANEESEATVGIKIPPCLRSDGIADIHDFVFGDPVLVIDLYEHSVGNLNVLDVDPHDAHHSTTGHCLEQPGGATLGGPMRWSTAMGHRTVMRRSPSACLRPRFSTDLDR
ncbi:MAG: hypothetical protein M3443_09085, partial [Actinomycetota bacterium]|nr:hypothetical protein [Actinomycetota bacterium]